MTRDAQIRDLQIRRFGVCVDVLLIRLDRLVSPKRRGGGACGRRGKRSSMNWVRHGGKSAILSAIRYTKFAVFTEIMIKEDFKMRVGVFTPLLSQFPLDKVFEKLKTLNIDTVELGTGNYPGDPHCKLSMLDNEAELKEFKKKLDDRASPSAR